MKNHSMTRGTALLLSDWQKVSGGKLGGQMMTAEIFSCGPSDCVQHKKRQRMQAVQPSARGGFQRRCSSLVVSIWVLRSAAEQRSAPPRLFVYLEDEHTTPDRWTHVYWIDSLLQGPARQCSKPSVLPASWLQAKKCVDANRRSRPRVQRSVHLTALIGYRDPLELSKWRSWSPWA